MKRKQAGTLLVRKYTVYKRRDVGQLKAGADGQMRVDLEKTFTVPLEITALIVTKSWSKSRKKLRYTELAAEAEACRWRTMICRVEVGQSWPC